MRFAFLDFDGTLYKGHLWRDLAEHYREQGKRRTLTWAYLLGHMALWPLNLIGLMSDEAFYASWQRDLSWLLRGVPREKLHELVAQQSIPRWATIADIVHATEFFLHADSGMITGQVLYLGGAG